MVGRDGAPMPAGTAAQLARLPGTDAAVGMLETDIFLLDPGLGWDAPWPAAGLSAGFAATLDLRVTSGSLDDVHGPAVAVSDVVADEGGLEVGDPLHARMADTRAQTLHVAAVYDRSAGLGDVVLDPAVARDHATSSADDAIFVVRRRGRRAVAGGLRRDPSRRPGADARGVPDDPAGGEQRPGMGRCGSSSACRSSSPRWR